MTEAPEVRPWPFDLAEKIVDEIGRSGGAVFAPGANISRVAAIIRRHLQPAALPWQGPAFAGWRIIRVHHYGIGPDRYLFVRMAHDTKGEIEADGPDGWALWTDLACKALEAPVLKDDQG